MLFLLPGLAFVFGFLLVMMVGLMFAPSSAQKNVERRLEEFSVKPDDVSEQATPHFDLAVATLKKVGEKLPRSPKEMGKLRLRLVMAGYRQEEALAVFFGIRAAVALAFFGLLASPILFKPNILFALGGLGLGYVLPGIVLAKKAKKRQHRIRLALPDALDLLVVSVEAGLGLDQALQRVAEELFAAYPDLCEEIRLVNLELRAGKGRGEALRNLADRTGVDDLSALVTMLIQTDKFGTSIAQSLRVFSETLRTKRRQRAEEAAAKTGVKMVFPLVFCIFPAIWVVTIGPAAIKFIQVLVPMGNK